MYLAPCLLDVAHLADLLSKADHILVQKTNLVIYNNVLCRKEKVHPFLQTSGTSRMPSSESTVILFVTNPSCGQHLLQHYQSVSFSEQLTP